MQVLLTWHITNSANEWGFSMAPLLGFHDTRIAGLGVVVISMRYPKVHTGKVAGI